MFDTLSAYWPHVLAVLSVLMGVPAAIHATMTKREVRSAVGWVGVILLSPIVGALLYAVAGINRMRRHTVGQQRMQLARTADLTTVTGPIGAATVAEKFGRRVGSLKRLSDKVTRAPLTDGNVVTPLLDGDTAYAAMLAAIAAAKRSVLLETYIFSRDSIGLRFVEALGAARRRGVEVKVLIDAVGARYSVPSIVGALRNAGIDVAVFNGNIVMGLRLPYANLRTHRKIMIVDGAIAFTGGMNIRAEFTRECAGAGAALDTHFRVTGPVVADLFRIAGDDWHYASGRPLQGEAWAYSPLGHAEGEAPVLARAVATGPDHANETNHKLLCGAISVADASITIMSPYFLPDRELIGALVTAARRGVAVDIIVPAVNNLTLVDRAMTAQFEQILAGGCRIFRSAGAFNHSKLFVIDETWSFVGSSNIDPRSLRLNFEIDLEIYDTGFARTIEERVRHLARGAQEVTVEKLRARPFLVRLIDRIFWLGSPYL